jgi:hypothetical protein
MPDNVTAPAGGVIFATDEIGGVHFPYAKLAWGADNQAVTITETDGARLPVAVQRIATTTRAYADAAGQKITTAGAAQVRSATIVATEVMLAATVDGYFRVGDAAVVAADAAGSTPISAGEKFHRQINSGQFVSFIRAGAADGSLFIVPVA